MESMALDEFTAMKVEAVGYEGVDDSTGRFTKFQLNMDNTPFLMKSN